ncbi:MAG TPA: FAD-dependent oxidoreductase [Ktedonobacterales bacterium]|jgi:thioredoxin reductase (NADPH)
MPIICAISADPTELAAFDHDLQRRFGADYEIATHSAPDDALAELDRWHEEEREVALILADLRLPGMTGIELLTHGHDCHPRAKRCLFLSYGETEYGAAIYRAVTLGQVDDYFMRPWGNPEERFYPMVSQLLGSWSRANRPTFETVRVVGDPLAARSHELIDILTRNSIPFGFYAADSAHGQALLNESGQPGQSWDGRLPVLVFYNGKRLIDPTNAEVAETIGAQTNPGPILYDVIIVGAGPAGLSAAVYAASEGLSAIILEREAFGGQAGTSSLIRNYLGFPKGVSGADLANRASEQAMLFGATLVIAQEAVGLEAGDHEYMVRLASGGAVKGKTVIIATGVSYNRLAIPDLDRFVGAGVFYGAAVTEARAMTGQRAFVVGGGNSAGQAAVYLAAYAEHVTMIVRGASLAATMSDYLIQQIKSLPNIEVRVKTEVVDARGGRRLEGLVLRNAETGVTEDAPAAAVFLLIGASPHTQWLPASIACDTWGFLLTGEEAASAGESADPSAKARLPALLETSLPGVFAVGDVRARAVKRVASAVGEGAISIRMVHDYLSKR